MSKAKPKTSPIALMPLPARKGREMRVASWNINGIRSILKKGFLDWLKSGDFDVVMLQEVKAHPEVLEEVGAFYEEAGFTSHHWASAQKSGYSGVLTLLKGEHGIVQSGIGILEFDSEGRWLEVDVGTYTFINAYFPNSQRDHARLPYKLRFCGAALDRLRRLLRDGRVPVLAGDINIAHTEIDLANPKTNKDNAGFLPEERDWMTHFLSAGWIDVFRKFESGGGHYTWWSYRPGVRQKNIGWRLDHFFIAKQHEENLNWMIHQPEVLGSDHCPIAISVRREPTQ
jgi:exodeoxyribonuclease-3